VLTKARVNKFYWHISYLRFIKPLTIIWFENNIVRNMHVQRKQYILSFFKAIDLFIVIGYYLLGVNNRWQIQIYGTLAGKQCLVKPARRQHKWSLYISLKRRMIYLKIDYKGIIKVWPFYRNKLYDIFNY